MKNIIHFISKIKAADVYVVYLGIFNKQIGPPTSMRDLSILLSSKYRVATSTNLVVDNESLSSSQAVESDNSYKPNLPSVIRALLKNIRYFFLLISFNIKVFCALKLNKDIRVIITQPQYFLPGDEERLFYIRRANLKLEESVGVGIIQCVTERIFVKNNNFHVIYLVQQEFNNDYSVIPNSFCASNFTLNLKDSLSTHFVGTWCSRKGADHILDLYDRLNGKFTLNVFGGLGNESSLNEVLLESDIVYHGVVVQPYNKFNVGDIFFTFSRIEGLQRSMIEAMLQGCIIIGFERPDTLQVNDFPGVFLSKISSGINGAQKILESICCLDIVERQKLGLDNRKYAESMFSDEHVLDLWLDTLER